MRGASTLTCCSRRFMGIDVVILSARAGHSATTGQGTGGWHLEQLCRALAERGHRGHVVPYESLVAEIATQTDLKVGAGFSAFAADAVLARIIPAGSLEQIIFRVDALHWLEQRGVPVINSPRAIERCVDKFYTTVLLHDAGLPVPETVVCETAEQAMPAIRRLLADGGAAVIKPIFGSMGHGLVRVDDVDVAWRVVRPLEQMRAVFYVQRAIDHDGRDVRVFIVGGRVVGAIERRAADGDWRTNVARGGTPRPIELPDEWVRASLAASAAVVADYCGVDLLPSRDGDLFVLEVNGIPGWEGVQRATGIDVAGRIVEHLESRVVAAGRAHVAGVQG